MTTKDLSLICLDSVTWEGHELRFKQPLTFRPFLDESQQLYVVEDVGLTFLAYAQTREQLVEEIGEQIVFMWNTYVVALEDDLATDALKLRQRLLEIVEQN